jgi:hypothetical protein
VTAAPFEFDGLKRALLIIEDISSLTELRSLLPICSYCHKIRTDGDYWQRVETYLSRQLDTDITHGICPTCLEKVKKDLDQTKKTWRQAEGGGPESG